MNPTEKEHQAINTALIRFRGCVINFIQDRDGKGRETAVKGTALNQMEDIIADTILDVFGGLFTVLRGRKACVPGYYRPSKTWDLVVKYGNLIVVVIELKSLTRSHGNNYNSRIEECLGCFADLEMYYNKNGGYRPYVGYLLLMDDSENTNKIRKCSVPVLKKFEDSGYLQRSKAFCKNFTEDHYNVSAHTLVYKQTEEEVVVEIDAIELFLKDVIRHLDEVLMIADRL